MYLSDESQAYDARSDMHTDIQILAPGALFAGRYRVVQKLRSGGMGSVYKVEDRSTRRFRALKLMHPSLVVDVEQRNRFAQEATIGAEINSEHIVEVLDAGVDRSGIPFLVMELLQGIELSDLLTTQKLSLENTCVLLLQLARGLEKAHQKHIVHRDLKPENVFLCEKEDGTYWVKILDFGIAKLRANERKTTRATGTPLYMAPEQTDIRSMVSPASDIWSFGLLAFQLLTGHTFWRAESLEQLFREVLINELPKASERAKDYNVSIPTELDAWFAQTIQRDPSKRFSSILLAAKDFCSRLNVRENSPFLPSNTPRETLRDEPLREGTQLMDVSLYVDRTAPATTEPHEIAQETQVMPQELKRGKSLQESGNEDSKHRRTTIINIAGASLAVSMAIGLFLVRQQSNGASGAAKLKKTESSPSGQSASLSGPSPNTPTAATSLRILDSVRPLDLKMPSPDSGATRQSIDDMLAMGSDTARDESGRPVTVTMRSLGFVIDRKKSIAVAIIGRARTKMAKYLSCYRDYLARNPSALNHKTNIGVRFVVGEGPLYLPQSIQFQRKGIERLANGMPELFDEADEPMQQCLIDAIKTLSMGQTNHRYEGGFALLFYTEKP